MKNLKRKFLAAILAASTCLSSVVSPCYAGTSSDATISTTQDDLKEQANDCQADTPKDITSSEAQDKLKKISTKQVLLTAAKIGLAIVAIATGIFTGRKFCNYVKVNILNNLKKKFLAAILAAGTCLSAIISPCYAGTSDSVTIAATQNDLKKLSNNLLADTSNDSSASSTKNDFKKLSNNLLADTSNDGSTSSTKNDLKELSNNLLADTSNDGAASSTKNDLKKLSNNLLADTSTDGTASSTKNDLKELSNNLLADISDDGTASSTKNDLKELSNNLLADISDDGATPSTKNDLKEHSTKQSLLTAAKIGLAIVVIVAGILTGRIFYNYLAVPKVVTVSPSILGFSPEKLTAFSKFFTELSSDKTFSASNFSDLLKTFFNDYNISPLKKYIPIQIFGSFRTILRKFLRNINYQLLDIETEDIIDLQDKILELIRK